MNVVVYVMMYIELTLRIWYGPLSQHPLPPARHHPLTINQEELSDYIEPTAKRSKDKINKLITKRKNAT